jgi:hypothetical protein
MWLTIAIPFRLTVDEGWRFVEFGISADNCIRHEFSNILLVLHNSGIDENLKRCGAQKESCRFVARHLPKVNHATYSVSDTVLPLPHSTSSSI